MSITEPIPGQRRGLELFPINNEPMTKKDFTSDQEVRWCPGCGDYAILSTFQSFMPTLGIKRENMVIISGIGCAARLPYYVDTFGMHSIHGRAPAIATGLAISRPDLSIWVVGGDGDLLSIGGNHLLHALRRNVNIKILLLNNRIYGLTKGQYSPTSEVGKTTKSTPMGSVDRPLNPLSIALGAEATFVARTMDSERKHLTSVLTAAAAHRGTAFVEIMQNCDIYNDGAFDAIKTPEGQAESVIWLEEGKPIRFGVDGQKGVRASNRGSLEIVDVDSVSSDSLLIHDPNADEPELAFALSRLGNIGRGVTPLGIFRSVERTAYDDAARAQVTEAVETRGAGDLGVLLASGDTWEIS